MPAKKQWQPRERLFVHEYFIDFNGTKAAIRAGYAVSGAKQEACRLLKKPHIAEEVARRKAAMLKKIDLNADNVLRQWATLGMVDFSNLLVWTEQGVQVRADAQPTPEQLIAIAAMVRGKPGGPVEIDTAPMRDALDALSRHFNLFKYPLDLGAGKDGEPTAIVVGRFSDVVSRFRRKKA